MEQSYHGFIYLWENTHPEATIHKKYIGQHVGLIEDGYVGSGSIFIRRYYAKKYKKYKGFWVRKIIQICNNQDELNNAEIHWIKETNAQYDPVYCNIKAGGLSGGKMHPKSILKMKKALKGRTVWNTGLKGVQKHSRETLEKKAISSKLYYESIFERDCQKILEYIQKNGYITSKMIPELLKLKCSITVPRMRLDRLIEQKKIECHHYGNIYGTRYMLPGFSLKIELLNFVRNNNNCYKQDITAHFKQMYKIGTFSVEKLFRELIVSGELINIRKYRKNVYCISDNIKNTDKIIK